MAYQWGKRNNSHGNNSDQDRPNQFASRPFIFRPEQEQKPQEPRTPSDGSSSQLRLSSITRPTPTVQPQPTPQLDTEQETEEQKQESKNTIKQQDSGNPEQPNSNNASNPTATIQTKLTIGEPGDKYEQEADAVAQKVMSGNTLQLSYWPEKTTPKNPVITRRKLPNTENIHPQIQRKSNAGTNQEKPDLEHQLNSKKGGGSSLDSDTRSFMESRFGADFSSVRVHTDSTAVQMNQQLGAQAFTHGNDIFFRQGKAPGKNELTAHELTHVIQQTGAVQPKTTTKQQKIPDLNSTEIGIQRACSKCEAEQKQEAQFSQGQVNTHNTPVQMNKDLGISTFTESNHLNSGEGKAPTKPEFNQIQMSAGISAIQMNKDLGIPTFTDSNHLNFGEGKAKSKNELIINESASVLQQKHEIKVNSSMEQVNIQPKTEAKEQKAGTGEILSVQNNGLILPQAVSHTREPQIQRSLWEGFTNTISNGVNSFTNTVSNGVSAVSQGVSSLLPNSLSELLGIPQPQEGNSLALNIIISALNNPLVKALPGFIVPSGIVGNLQQAVPFIQGAQRVLDNPDIVKDGLQQSLGQHVEQVPGQAQTAIENALPSSPCKETHLQGIMRHLRPKLDYLKNNWWEIIQQTGRDLIWPWPGVSQDFNQIKEKIQAAGSSLWNLKFSESIDNLTAIWRLVNSMVGRLYGWFFIASTLIGAILGGIFGGGIGAIPGAAVGASIAGSVGKGLTASVIAAETASIGKAAYDLTANSQTQEQNEEDYNQIASSGLTLGITGAMALVGEVASRLAKTVIQRVGRNMWKLPYKRGKKGEKIRGDVNEFRVRDALMSQGVQNLKPVTWLELKRRNFPGIDLQYGGRVIITPRPGKKAPLYTVVGGNIISVKSVATISRKSISEAFDTIKEDIGKLANFQKYQNVVIQNPQNRTLMVATETALDANTTAALQQYAAQQGVQLQLFANSFPPNHPSLISIDSIPGALGTTGSAASSQVNDQGEAANPCAR